MTTSPSDGGPQARESEASPSITQALGVWLLGLAAILGASTVVSGLAAATVPTTALDGNANALSRLLSGSPPWIGAITLANELSLALVLWFAVSKLRLSPRRLFALAPISPRALLGGLLVGFGMLPIAELVARIARDAIGEAPMSQEIVVAVATKTTPLEFVALLGALALAPALAEEALFRGFITTGFERHGAWLAIVVPSLLFGIFHLEVTQAAGTFVLGLGFGWLRWRTGNLTLSIIVHASHNALVLSLVRATGGADLEGVASLSETLASVAFGALALALGTTLVKPHREALR